MNDARKRDIIRVSALIKSVLVLAATVNVVIISCISRTTTLESNYGDGLRSQNLTRRKEEGHDDSKEKQQEYGANNRDRGIAACLLVKDDNNRLIEWIAYHHLIFPLRHLIVAVDPTSITSPSPILDRWRTSNVEMDVIEWHDGDYMSTDMNVTRWIEGEKAGGVSKRKLKLHQFRQHCFISACALHHKEMNRTWVALTDVDEYVAFNAIDEDDPKTEFKRGEREAEVAAKEKDPSFLSAREQKMKAREDLPQFMDGNATILEFIKNGRDGGGLHFNHTCVTIPRLFFSAMESTEYEKSESRAEELGFNVTHFNTLRFFKHARKGGFEHNRFAKVFIDVSRIPAESLRSLNDATNPIQAHRLMIARKMNIHKPFEQCVRPITRYEEAFLRVHHYLGSWEEYSFRDDDRRNRSIFERKARVAVGSLHTLEPWLSGFVKAVGLNKAHYLLDGVGQLGEWKVP